MRRLIIAVVVLVGLLVLADFGTATAAEYAVSKQMRERLSLPEDPSVRINGPSFLVQALAGVYPSVDVSLEKLQVGPLHNVEVRATLHDVRAGLGDLINGSSRFRVDDTEGVVAVGASDLLRMTPQVSKLGIQNVDANAIDAAVLDGADPTLRDVDPRTAARFVVTTKVAGQDEEVGVLAVLVITGDDQIRIIPRDVRPLDDTAADLPSATRSALRKAFTVELDPGNLPFRVTPTSLRAAGNTLEIAGQVRNLRIGAGESSSSSSAEG